MKKAELLEVLNLLKPGISCKELVDQSDHVIFKKKYVYSFDGEIGAWKKFSSPIQGAVKAVQFMALINRIKDEDIDIKTKNDKITINNDRMKVEFKVLSDIELEFPFDPSEIKKWKKLPDNFLEAIKLTSFSTSKDPSDGVLTHLYVKGDNLMSCDRFRLTKYKLDSTMEEFLLPVSSAEKLLKYPVKEYYVEEGWVCFKGEGDVYVNCLRTVEEYPTMEHLFKVKGKKIKLPAGSKEAIEDVNILSTAEIEEDRFINITSTGTELFFLGQGQYGSMEEKIENVDLKGKIFDIKVHPVYIKQIIEHVDTFTIGEDSLLFEGKNFQHVLSLTEE